MTNYPYIVQREKRLAQEQQQRLRIMGGTIAVALWLVCLFQYYLVTTNIAVLDIVWHIGIWLAVLLFTVIMIRPYIIQPVEKIMKIIGHFIGGLLLKTTLFILYFIIVTPLGFVLQKVQKNNLFLSWDTEQMVVSTWEDKQPTYDNREDKPVPVFFFPVYLVYVMVQNKAYFIIPLIINLLLIAMLVFFVQTPVVAPFVYTVF